MYNGIIHYAYPLYTNYFMEEFDLDKMGMKFARARIARDLSANSVSYKLGKSRNYVNDVEKGRVNMPIKTFFELCQILNIDPREFFD